MMKGKESRENGKLPGEDEMSTKTSVVSSADGPALEPSGKRVLWEELADPESTITVNANLAEMREMVTKYIHESEEMKNTGDCMRAIRRHGGAVLMIYGVQRKDFKKIRILLAAEEVFVPDMTHLKRCGSIGGAMYKRERLRRAKKKDSVYPIGDGEKCKSQKFGQKKGAHDGTRTRAHVGMSKRLDLITEEKEGTSHQATLVTGRINLIYTRRK